MPNVKGTSAGTLYYESSPTLVWPVQFTIAQDGPSVSVNYSVPPLEWQGTISGTFGPPASDGSRLFSASGIISLGWPATAEDPGCQQVQDLPYGYIEKTGRYLTFELSFRGPCANSPFIFSFRIDRACQLTPFTTIQCDPNWTPKGRDL
jgi:hypothetical protein